MGPALVTGASRGIGRALARELAARGHDLVLTARSAAALDELAGELRAAHGVRVETVAADLSRPGAVDLVTRQDVELLVNNAGVGAFGDFVDAKPEDLAHVIALNVCALTELTQRVLPPMRARGRGRILLVASTVGFAPGPRSAVYAASKAYVLSLGLALAAELAGTGVTVTTVCPGRTDTEFAHRAGWGESNRLRAKRALSPEEVARSALRALDAGSPRHVTGAANCVLAALVRALPPALAARGIAWLRG